MNTSKHGKEFAFTLKTSYGLKHFLEHFMMMMMRKIFKVEATNPHKILYISIIKAIIWINISHIVKQFLFPSNVS